MAADPAPPVRPLRAALPALAAIGVGLAVAQVARHAWPTTPPWVTTSLVGAITASALLLGPFRRAAFARFLLESDLFFLSGVVAALAWANVDLASLEALVAPARFAVNEVLMALFFGLATKEIAEAARPGGALGSLRKAALPLVATAGGMAGPACVYLAGCALLGRPDLVRGWAIPTATDVAFSALAARFIFGAAHPAIPFLLLLAIADDAGGLAVLAIAYPQGERHLLPLVGLVALGVTACLLLRRGRVASPWPYLALGGVPAWFGLHEGGLHPALCLVPIVPWMPHAAHDAGIYVETEDHPPSTMERFQRGAAAPVALILGLFALSNAGVPLGGVGTTTGLVLVALLAGKLVGISAAVGLGTRLGLTLPEGLGAREVLILATTAGVGFTVALFVSTVAFPAGPVLAEAKMGALLSVVAAPVAIAAGRLAGVARRPAPTGPADARAH